MSLPRDTGFEENFCEKTFSKRELYLKASEKMSLRKFPLQDGGVFIRRSMMAPAGFEVA